uniref:NADH-ubiquinone oxidoreductase chain 2 n=1 Tax=Torleya grandiforceps TaxID=2748052 RepID=A0A7D6FJD8_9INSE|nr:NADH dehydrogenase subunit 2 [Torleya grandiforceps]QLP89008.1 NADH dehydrogenase subunit 2 [Torleya grandiforceps]
MFNYPARILFCLTLCVGTLISISSNSWFGAWAGLEVNLLSFIPLISTKGMMSVEASLKYFLTQALASILLFFSILFFLGYYKTTFVPVFSNFSILMLFNTALLIKLGAAPFHFWFPGVMEGVSWGTSIILMTWQKLAPLVLISYTFYSSVLIYTSVLLSSLIGALGGMNQTSLRKIMAYSSINHLGWILSGMLLNNLYWFVYFLFYSFLSGSLVILFMNLQLSQFNHLFLIKDSNFFNKISLFGNFLSLGGLPPFLGFFPKWLIIQGLATSGHILLISIITSLTLVVLFYYLRIFFASITISNMGTKWQLPDPYWSPLSSCLAGISIFGLPLFPLFYSFF